MLNSNKILEGKSYDGITIKELRQENRLVKITHYNLLEALNQDNPRNVFLNGHLYIEDKCDELLLEYFCYYGYTEEEPYFLYLKRDVFNDFLRSRHFDYSNKVYLLKNLKLDRDQNPDDVLVESKIITSLKAIGAVRNAFHHNLVYQDALDKFTKSDKFVFVSESKVLSKYSDTFSLKDDFILEVKGLYRALQGVLDRLDEYQKKMATKNTL